MAITWNIDEARSTVQAQMDEANRLDAVIDELATERDKWRARAEAAEGECDRLREQMATLEAADDMYQHRAAIHVGNEEFVAVCGDKAAIDKLARDLIEAARLREQVKTLTAVLTKLSAEHMALIERTADW